MASGDLTPPRDERLRRAANNLDAVAPEDQRALYMARARVEQANQQLETALDQRNKLILDMRAKKVPMPHIAYLLGLSYDMVALVQREARLAEKMDGDRSSETSASTPLAGC